MVEDKKLQEPSIEDTLSSIKTIVEKVENGEEPTSDVDIDSILDLTETEMVSNNAESSEELIDIKSFDENGDLKQADEKTKVIAQAQQGDDAAIDAISQSLKSDGDESVDDILNNLNQTAEANQEVAAEPEVNVDDIMAQVEVSQGATEDLNEKAEMLENASKEYDAKDFEGSQETIEEDITEQVDATPAQIADAMKQVAGDAIMKQATQKVALKAVPGASGLQVGFPVEVLAEALRPMVSDWVEANLASIVEKLVKEELTKLADK